MNDGVPARGTTRCWTSTTTCRTRRPGHTIVDQLEDYYRITHTNDLLVVLDELVEPDPLHHTAKPPTPLNTRIRLAG